MRPHRIVPLLLLALTAAVFHPVRDHEFVDHDDYTYVVENPNLAEGLGLESVLRAFTQPYAANWIPLTWISLQIDHELYGLEPAGYLLTNVALHALSALLLFFALARMTRAPWPSAFTAAIFAVHPLHVESVAWATERKDVLCGLFWMLSLCAYAYYAERPESRRRYALVASGVTLALLSKPLAVTLPFALLLLDYWPLGRLGSGNGGRLIDPLRLRRALLEKLPLLALAGVAAIVTYAVQEETGVVRSAQFPPALRASNALLTYALYLRDAIWPSGLAVFYPYPHQGVPGSAVLSALLVLCGVSALALRSARRRPYLLTGWLWYLATLAPMIGIVQVGLQARADRYTYIPLIGVAIMLAWGATELAARWRAARIPLAVAGAGAVAALASAASVQVGVWRDTISLFERAIAVTEGNYLAHHRLAATYRANGDTAEAERHYRQTLRINPHWAAPHFEYASMLQERGACAEATIHLERGLRIDPEHARARKLFGLCLLELGRYAEARAELTRALAHGEDLAEIHAGLGFAAAAQGDAEAAIRHSREALRLDPSQLFAANNLAWALATHPRAALRDPQEAVRVAESAVSRSNAESSDLLDTLAAAYASAGRFEEAVRAEADAVRSANAMGQRKKAEELRQRLELYRAEQPYIEGQALPLAGPPRTKPVGLRGAVLIVLDTVRADHLSAYGYGRPTSPALEELAARGVLFERAISNAPWTLPSVAALLASDASARSFDRQRRQLERSVVDDFVWAGFTTAAFTEGGFVSRHFGLDQGFLEYAETEGAVQLARASREFQAAAGSAIDETFAAAREWLSDHRDERFFLLIHTYEPHTPYTRRTFAEGLDPGRFGPTFTLDAVREIQNGEIVPTQDELRYLEALYDGGILESDRHVGELLEHLERIGLAERTLIVVTSDHGEDLGDHFPANVGDHGHTLRDALVRVPLILANPQERYPVRRVAAQVRIVDIMPTVAALLHVTLPEGLAGLDLTPLLRGQRAPERIAFGGFTKVGPDRAFISADGFKYIETTGGQEGRRMLAPPPDEQLYDLHEDPNERRNLVQARPELQARLSEELRRRREASGHDILAPGLEGLPAELQERLRSLGYVE